MWNSLFSPSPQTKAKKGNSAPKNDAFDPHGFPGAEDAFDERKLQSLLSSAMTEIDPNGFAVTDEDLDDPSFLNELNDLAADEGGGPSKVEQLHDLEARVRSEKVRAVKLKQAGNVDEAKRVYFGVKDLEKKAQALREELGPEHHAPAPASQPATVPVSVQPQQRTSASTEMAPPPPSYAEHMRLSSSGHVLPPPQSSPYNSNNGHYPSPYNSNNGHNPPSYTSSNPSLTSSMDIAPVYTPPSSPLNTNPSAPLSSASVIIPSPQQLHAQFGAQESPRGDSMLVDLPAMPAYPVPMTPPKEPIAVLTAANPPSAPKSSLGPAARVVNEELLAIADNRIEECKKAAVHFKVSHKEKALEALKRMKLIQGVRERLANGFKVALAEVPSAITIEDIEDEIEDENIAEEGEEGDEAEGEAGAQAMEVDEAEEAESDPMETETPSQGNAEEIEKQRQAVFEAMEAAIQRQIADALEKAKKFKDLDKEKAMNYLRLKKLWLRDVELLQEARKIPKIPPPKFHYDTKEDRVEIQNADISLHEMEVNVINAVDLPFAPDSQKLTFYASCEFGYPDSNTPQTFVTDQVTATGPPFNPVFNFKKKLRIERKKTLQRFMSNRKLTVAIFSVSGWAFFKKEELVGKAQVNLADLLTKSSVTLETEVFDGRKSTGATVRVQLRIKTPIEVKEVQVTVEKFLLIDKHFSLEDIVADPSLVFKGKQPQSAPKSPKPAPAKKPAPQKTATPSKPPSTPQKAPNSPAPVTSSAQKSAPNTPKPAAASKPVEAAPAQPPAPKLQLPKYKALEWMVSNEVMEAEQATLQHEIAELKKQNKDPFDKELRLQLLEVRVGQLISEISSGELTQDAYVSLVKHKIDEEEELLEKLGQLKLEADAAACRKRIQLMKSELGL